MLTKIFLTRCLPVEYIEIPIFVALLRKADFKHGFVFLKLFYEIKFGNSFLKILKKCF
jgi:hypothetical protein